MSYSNNELIDIKNKLKSLGIEPEKIPESNIKNMGKFLENPSQLTPEKAMEILRSLGLNKKTLKKCMKNVLGTESRTIIKDKKIGRNDKCPCSSGKKYKKCCLLSENSQ